MRRSRSPQQQQQGDEQEQQQQQQAASSSLMLLPHSRYFVPYTGRYYHHFLLRNSKGVPGHNMRFLLHSNGLCVVCIDTSHILVQSFANLINSVDEKRTAAADNSDGRQRRVIHRVTYCGAFPRDAQSTATQCTSPPAGVYKCDNASDFFALVQQGKAALGPSSLSHTVKGTRGERNRFEATAKVAGKHKRHAQYVQDEMTLCSFAVDTLVKCPQCNGWQLCQLSTPQQQQQQQTQSKSKTEQQQQSGPAQSAAAADNNSNSNNKQQAPRVPPNCALSLTSSFAPHRVIKIPVGVNSVLLDVNQAVADDAFELALREPIGRGFMAVVQPRQDVSFVGPESKFERLSGVGPFVAPSEEAKLFVADAFTGCATEE